VHSARALQNDFLLDGVDNNGISESATSAWIRSIDFFSERAGAVKPANDQNQFGGNIGEPIVLNTAFFVAYCEGTRITRGATRLTRVPTADDRAGIFGSPVKDPSICSTPRISVCRIATSPTPAPSARSRRLRAIHASCNWQFDWRSKR
jgi:hypothetical protein